MLKSITKEYTVESEKLSKKYNILAFADTHFGPFVSSELLNNMKNEILSSPDKIDLILISGDIMNTKSYLNDKMFDKKKRLLDELSILADAPIFMCLGIHDVGLFSEKEYESVIKRFESLRENTNLYPLNNSTSTYDGIDISGITLPNEAYKTANVFGKNGEVLNDTLSEFNKGINSEPFNICLIHDPLAAYYSWMQNESSTAPYDLIFSGHLHGGYLSKNDLLAESVLKEGYVEYFKDGKLFAKIPFCGGIYNLGNTKLVVNEGIRRFNGWIPWFINTTPFYSKIELSPKLTMKK